MPEELVVAELHQSVEVEPVAVVFALLFVFLAVRLCVGFVVLVLQDDDTLPPFHFKI